MVITSVCLVNTTISFNLILIIHFDNHILLFPASFIINKPSLHWHQTIGTPPHVQALLRYQKKKLLTRLSCHCGVVYIYLTVWIGEILQSWHAQMGNSLQCLELWGICHGLIVVILCWSSGGTHAWPSKFSVRECKCHTYIRHDLKLYIQPLYGKGYIIVTLFLWRSQHANQAGNQWLFTYR